MYRWRTIPVSISEKVQNSVKELFHKLSSPLIFNGVTVAAEQKLTEEHAEVLKDCSKDNSRIFVSIGNLCENKNQTKCFHRCKCR